MRNSRYIEKKWMQFKVSTLSASITVFIIASIPTQISASDIDIYQAGGTGDVDILFMLDVSNSMYTYQFTNDYAHNNSSKKQCNVAYVKSNTGNTSVTFRDTGGNKNGSYRRDGSSGNYTFVYTGSNSNRYEVNTVTNYVSQGSQTQYNLIACDRRNPSGTAASTYAACSTSSLLTEDRIIYDRAYSTIGDPFCQVDLMPLLNSTNTNDRLYVKRIQSVCEGVDGQEEMYICLTRFANLKKALISLVNSESTKENMYFSLGYYPHDAGGRVGVTGKIVMPKNIKMNKSGKKDFLDLVLQLPTANGTPIANAYDEAIKHFGDVDLTGTSESCIGRGLYFLTDGVPQLEDSKPTEDSRASAPMTSTYWTTIARKSRTLKNDKAVKTATVGFGKDYFANGATSEKGVFSCNLLTAGSQQAQLCLLGNKGSGVGEGGFYNAQSTQDLIESITTFVSDVTKPVEGSTMGTSTIPVDALNTTQLQPYSYFPMFKPLIGTKDQLWAGNLKKFKVADGTIKDILDNSVFNGTTIRDSLQDYWYSEVTGDPDKKMAWGGHLSRLKVHHYPKVENSELKLQRNLYVNINGSLESVTDILGTNKATNSHYLYGLLGFSNLNETDFTALAGKNSSDQLVYLQNKAANPGKYQMGSVIHSTPVLLTQKGALAYDKLEGFSSQNREDYILFGTTQGVLHVVKAGQQTKTDETADTAGGKEVFSFVPKEFLTRQQQGFAEGLAQGRTLAADSFFYGVDGPWVAHTEYEPLIQDTYKKDNDGKDEIASTSSALVVRPNSTKSHQYVYGGLRMGGDSYYALNLSDMSDPKLLFHIDPAKYKADSTSTHPLSYMGQSWSKPTITYIKWNGQKKLAMIVGGGYDMKYETAGFSNSTSGAVKGNGVYIFDAVNGDLLWWGSSSVVGASQVGTKDNEQKYESTKINSMTNSIPSRVKAIDRDGDGITDHLYVGDLGGKLFRIDLNPHHIVSSEENERKPFILNAFQLADVGNHRIYEAPAFTIHKDGSTRYAVVTLGTGDRSNPLNSSGEKDILVGIYDSTVTLPTPTILQVPGTAPNTPVAKIIGMTDLKQIYKQDASVVTKPLGWYFELPEKKEGDITYRERVLEEVVALDNYLYVSMFNPEKSTAAESATKCTGGITGESVVYQFCLPYGECSANQTERKEVGVLGPGILGLTIGPSSNKNHRTLIFNEVPNQKPDEFETKNKLIPQRWFEYSPYVKSKS